MSRRLSSRLAGVRVVCFSACWCGMGAGSSQPNAAQQSTCSTGTEPDHAATESRREAILTPASARSWRRPPSRLPHTAEKWGHELGTRPGYLFALSIALNFAGIALFFYLLLKSKLPQAFRERTAAIQKGIKEAQAASADATRRLSDIEARLSKLDTEVAEIRTRRRARSCR